MKPSPVVLVALALGVACRRAAPPDESRLPGLRAEHERLHQELDAKVAGDAFVQEALAGGKGQIILAVRSSVVQDVLREVARVYFDRMTLDLGALDATAERPAPPRHVPRSDEGGRLAAGDLHPQAPGGAAGEDASPACGGDERDGSEASRARAEARGRITLRFSWDSASIANILCRDFEVVRELEGSTVRQEHTIGGTFRLAAGPDSVRVDPVFAEDVIHLKVVLPDESWAVVREALESQDSLARCGMLMNPEKVVERLKELASKGFRVKLPKVMFRGFRFPGAFERTARIEGRPVAVGLRTEALQMTPRAMWSRASIGIASNRARSRANDRAKPQNASVPREPVVELRGRCPFRSPRRPAADAASGGR